MRLTRDIRSSPDDWISRVLVYTSHIRISLLDSLRYSQHALEIPDSPASDRHSRESGNPEGSMPVKSAMGKGAWIPAFAGMTDSLAIIRAC